MSRDSRDDNVGEDAPISVEQALRSAKTAAAMGRVPKPQATTKIAQFDLDAAIAKSREVDDPNEAPTIAPPPGALLEPSELSVEVEIGEALLDPSLEELLDLPPGDDPEHT